MPNPAEFHVDYFQLWNFRGFGEVGVGFDRHLTVIVAPNGGGKTALLDGLALALRPFVSTVSGQRKNEGFLTRDRRLTLTPNKVMEPMGPLFLVGTGVFGADSVVWSRGKPVVSANSLDDPEVLAIPRTTTSGDKYLRRAATMLSLQNQKWILAPDLESAPTFPLVAYYGAARRWANTRTPGLTLKHDDAPNARIRGYTGALSSVSDFREFRDWFGRYSYESKNERSPHGPQKALDVIRSAVNEALAPSGWRDIEWDFAETRLSAHHGLHGQLPVDFLSDGIRTMIGLVADIAHRAFLLNPQFEEDAATKTPGIVLIDEVDMHLHPTWQQTVLGSLQRAFPEVQFIVTTHSPQVLTTVPKKNIRVLERKDDDTWTAEEPPMSPLGHESGDALAYIMGTHPSPEIAQLLPDVHAYEVLARAGRAESDEARAILTRLSEAGFEFNQADLAVFRFFSQKAQERAPKS